VLRILKVRSTLRGDILLVVVAYGEVIGVLRGVPIKLRLSKRMLPQNGRRGVSKLSLEERTVYENQQHCYGRAHVAYHCSINATSSSKRDRVIAEVERLGGKVEVDETSKQIVKIDLHGTKITDADLVFLGDVKEIRTLDLRLTHIGDAGVEHLKNLRNLGTLNLFRTNLTDVGLAHLRKLNKLETLLIGGTKVTDPGLVNLKGMKDLKKLSLFQTQVSDRGIPYLKMLSNLESLLISGTKITDAGARELQQALPKVRFGETT